jgi:hypothetical protein
LKVCGDIGGLRVNGGGPRPHATLLLAAYASCGLVAVLLLL